MATSTTILYTPSHRASVSFHCPNPSSFHFDSSSIPRKRCLKPSKFRRKPLKICGSSSSVKDCVKGDANSHRSDRNVDIWEDSGCVEVIGIGSRVDSVMDFCLRSPSTFQSLRFWNVIRRQSLKGQLHQRLLGKDTYPNIVEASLNQLSHFKAVVLVASAGYGDDYVIATDILRMIKSGGGLVVAVILKPFSFEGQRRQDEVKILVDRLQDCVNFCIDIDIDTLLKMDFVTLDEALKSAYKAVSSAITAVSFLVSERDKKHIHSLHSSVRQITCTEVMKVLESYREGKVGFGVGHNVEASIIQAVYDCPFLSMGLRDLEGIVICIVSSSCSVGDNDVASLLRTFREATECTKEVILSIVQDPELKPNLIATTVITVCVADKKYVQKSSILSRLADSIPFVFNLLRRNRIESEDNKESNLRENLFPPMLANLVDGNEVPDTVPVIDTTENVEMYSGEEMLWDENSDEKECNDDGIDRTGDLGADDNPAEYMDKKFQGTLAYGREPVISRNFGPGYRTSQEWAEEEMNVSRDISVADNPKIFHLPVGVKPSDDSQDSFDKSNSRQPAERINDANGEVQPSAVPSAPSLNGLTDVGFEAVTDFWNSASTLLRGRQIDNSKKQGVLSARAASMLESERDSKARWSRMVEIRYRGGVYKGRCQGGLPEGRGRLTFLDGSVYDGMWRYGKRSGLGSLFFSNGDVFHGSWRDDLMHGKGWLYFHTGERWFANFWKGRANGEGRFYSRCGEVFFGHFQDGWRHGHFLCVKIDGTRYVEVWDEGILVSSEEMD